jgi:hypothetical protein
MRERHQDRRGWLCIDAWNEQVIEVRVGGSLSPALGAAPRFARRAASRADRCSVFLDVRELDSFDGAVRSAWLDAVLEHRHRLDEVVVLSRGMVVTLSARAASVALAPFGLRFDVFTDEHHYLARRNQRAGYSAIEPIIAAG